ncbi:YkgJ family cysteine cluster protein [Rhizobium sp. No.120]
MTQLNSPCDLTASAPSAAEIDCQTCGACCCFSSEWPRFTTEADDDLALIPRHYVEADQRGMRCEGSRCSALLGEVGINTSCLVYEVRPDVCRACVPGDEACRMARAKVRF